MAKKIAISTLNARTIDILNVIRANASAEYQSLVPSVTQEKDIVKVGEILVGYPNLANQFLNALVNRIALVRIQSATFNNRFAVLKKGYLEFGETVEEIFVKLAQSLPYSAEKAEGRELKRYVPDVEAAFHTINWRVVYPVTIQNEDLKLAFLSVDGVGDLIGRIIEQVYTSADYDEYLLIKYMIIKAVAHGKMYPVPIDTSSLTNAAKAFRARSDGGEFMSSEYNEAGVMNTMPKDRQYIIMDTDFNAAFDVDVLSAAFNMSKAEYVGRRLLVDGFNTFDNARFAVIRAQSTYLEEVTAAELALMADVKAILVDERWFQIYDNLIEMKEKEVASGLYWNYFLHIWKTVSHSPFHEAIVFVANTADTTLPSTFTYKVGSKSLDGEGNVTLTLVPNTDTPTLETRAIRFVQTQDAVEELVAVQPYGALIFPASATSATIALTVGGQTYISSAAVAKTADVGDTITFAVSA